MPEAYSGSERDAVMAYVSAQECMAWDGVERDGEFLTGLLWRLGLAVAEMDGTPGSVTADQAKGASMWLVRLARERGGVPGPMSLGVPHVTMSVVAPLCAGFHHANPDGSRLADLACRVLSAPEVPEGWTG